MSPKPNATALRDQLQPLLDRALEGEVLATSQHPDSLAEREAFKARYDELVARNQSLLETGVAFVRCERDLGVHPSNLPWPEVTREAVAIATELAEMRGGDRGPLRIAGYYRRELVIAIDRLQAIGVPISEMAFAVGVEAHVLRGWMHEARDHRRDVERRRKAEIRRHEKLLGFPASDWHRALIVSPQKQAKPPTRETRDSRERAVTKNRR